MRCRGKERKTVWEDRLLSHGVNYGGGNKETARGKLTDKTATDLEKVLRRMASERRTVNCMFPFGLSRMIFF